MVTALTWGGPDKVCGAPVTARKAPVAVLRTPIKCGEPGYSMESLVKMRNFREALIML